MSTQVESLCLVCNQAKEMLWITYRGFKTHSIKGLEEAKEIGKRVHSQNEELTPLLIKAGLNSLVGFPGHFERIGDKKVMLTHNY